MRLIAGRRLFAGMRLIAGRRLFAGMRLIAGRSLRKRDSREEGIKSGLFCFPPLLVQQLLVVSQIGHHLTPRQSCPFDARVDLLQVAFMSTSRSTAGSSPSTALPSMASWDAAQPPPPPPTDTAASPVRRGPLLTAPRQSSPAKSRCLLPQFRRGQPSLPTRGTLRKPLGQVKAPEVDGELRTVLLPRPTDAGLRYLPGIADMSNCIMNGVGPPVTPHHVLLKFHLRLLGSLCSLLRLIQRHIALHTRASHVF